MTAVAKKQDASRSATVLQFPGAMETSTGPARTGWSTAQMPALTQLREELKAAVESYVIEAYFQELLTRGRTPDTPFDAIYIAKLSPDPVTATDLIRLATFSRVADISDTLDFNDEWA